MFFKRAITLSICLCFLHITDNHAAFDDFNCFDEEISDENFNRLLELNFSNEFLNNNITENTQENNNYFSPKYLENPYDQLPISPPTDLHHTNKQLTESPLSYNIQINDNQNIDKDELTNNDAFFQNALQYFNEDEPTQTTQKIDRNAITQKIIDNELPKFLNNTRPINNNEWEQIVKIIKENVDHTSTFKSFEHILYNINKKYNLQPNAKEFIKHLAQATRRLTKNEKNKQNKPEMILSTPSKPILPNHMHQPFFTTYQNNLTHEPIANNNDYQIDQTQLLTNFFEIIKKTNSIKLPLQNEDDFKRVINILIKNYYPDISLKLLSKQFLIISTKNIYSENGKKMFKKLSATAMSLHNKK